MKPYPPAMMPAKSAKKTALARTIRVKRRPAVKALVLSIPICLVVPFSPTLGLLVWFSFSCFLYRFFASSSKRTRAARATEMGKHLSGAAAELAFSLAVTGSEISAAEALARGEYSTISRLAMNSLLKSMNGLDVRSSLATYLRHQRAVPTAYLIELLLSPNPQLFDVEHLLEQTEELTRRSFAEFTKRLNALLPAYFFAAFFLPFSVLILSTLMGDLGVFFLAIFFPLFSLTTWLISKMLLKAGAKIL